MEGGGGVVRTAGSPNPWICAGGVVLGWDFSPKPVYCYRTN